MYHLPDERANAVADATPPCFSRDLRDHERLAVGTLRDLVRLLREFADKTFPSWIQGHPRSGDGSRKRQIDAVGLQMLTAATADATEGRLTGTPLLC